MNFRVLDNFSTLESSAVVFTLIGIALLLGVVSSLHKLGMLSKTPQDSYYSLISQGGSRMIFKVFNISPAAGFSSIAATPLGRSTKPGSSSEQQDFCGSLDHFIPSPIIAAASENSSEF